MFKTFIMFRYFKLINIVNMYRNEWIKYTILLVFLFIIVTGILIPKTSSIPFWPWQTILQVTPMLLSMLWQANSFGKMGLQGFNRSMVILGYKDYYLNKFLADLVINVALFTLTLVFIYLYIAILFLYILPIHFILFSYYIFFLYNICTVLIFFSLWKLIFSFPISLFYLSRISCGVLIFYCNHIFVFSIIIIILVFLLVSRIFPSKRIHKHKRIIEFNDTKIRKIFLYIY